MTRHFKEDHPEHPRWFLNSCKKMKLIQENGTVIYPNKRLERKMRRVTPRSNRSDEPQMSETFKLPIKVAYTDNEETRWGAFAIKDLEKNAFVGEYTGVIVDDEYLKIRTSESKYDDAPASSKYLFRLGCDLMVNGEGEGSNLTRFINHSANPNLIPKIINHYGTRRVAFYTNRKIGWGEELNISYGPDGKIFNKIVIDGLTIRHSTLLRQVRLNGGYKQVSKQKKWRSIAEGLGVPTNKSKQAIHLLKKVVIAKEKSAKNKNNQASN